MNITAIRQLNALNAQFYETVAEEFNKTRQFYWEGWKQLEPILKKKKLSQVLDIGCGNGRFGEFLFKHVTDKEFSYHGLDNSTALLGDARQRLGPLPFQKEFAAIDIVESLLEKTLTSQLPGKKYDLIAALGVLHHIPSQNLREQLAQTLSNSLTSGGILVMTAWQFRNEERFLKKQVDPHDVDIHPDDLEPNDFILDWQRGVEAYRYCHFIDNTELESLVGTSGLQAIKRYNADGKSGNLNTYLVLQKP